MLYRLLKIIVRLHMKIFCRRIVINNTSHLSRNGPLLLASNHPNSFLDAIIFDILFEQPIWSLARGDAFRKKWIGKMLRSLKMFPIYRASEGAENLNNNYETFEQCKRIFRQNGIVLIFSEGRCINEWKLRPLKKGTARLAISSWEEDIPLGILPVGINYSSFRRFGKNVIINFGNTIKRDNISSNGSIGQRYREFTSMLETQLASLVFEIDQTDKKKKNELLVKEPGRARLSLLILPAIFGWLVHAPLYLPIQKIAYRKTAHNDHYDSVMAAALLLTYPVYLVVIAILAYYYTGSNYSFALPALMPFCAWSYVQLKPQLDR